MTKAEAAVVRAAVEYAKRMNELPIDVAECIEAHRVLLDRSERLLAARAKGRKAKPPIRHVCGAQGFDPTKGDKCQACRIVFGTKGKK